MLQLIRLIFKVYLFVIKVRNKNLVSLKAGFESELLHAVFCTCVLLLMSSHFPLLVAQSLMLINSQGHLVADRYSCSCSCATPNLWDSLIVA